MTRWLISAMAAIPMIAGTLVSEARADLIQTVWLNIPEYQFAPSAGTITQEQVYTSGATPAYSFVNSALTFSYNNGSSTIHQYFGADAAGAALSDNSAAGYFAFDAKGYIYVAQTGTYTFNLGNTFNQVDDAARVTIDGNLVVQQNFQGLLTPYLASLVLTAGYHTFDLFSFQTEGGLGLRFSATGPDGGAVQFTSAVPAPGALALLGLGFIVLGGLRRKANAA